MSEKFSLEPSVTLKTVDGQLVLFSKKSGDFYGLNDSAGYLVQELINTDFEATIHKASTYFKVEEGELRHDLKEIIADLEKNQLLRKVSA